MVIRKNFPKLTEREFGMVALSGILINMLIALILALFTESKFIMVNYLIALYSMIPIPNLEGVRIFFGSRIMYFSSVVILLLSLLAILTRNGYLIILFIIIILITLIKFSTKKV